MSKSILAHIILSWNCFALLLYSAFKPGQMLSISQGLFLTNTVQSNSFNKMVQLAEFGGIVNYE